MAIPGGFIDFPGGLGIGPPAGPPPPDPVNTPPTEVVVIGSPVTVSPMGAIFALWRTRGDLYTQITGGLWTGEAPATVVALPYAVLTQVSDTEVARTTGPKLFQGIYQISVMAADLTSADSLCRSVSAAYDGATLDLDGFVSCLAGDVRWMLGTKSLGLLGEDCWTSYVELQIMYTR